jgi:hypothetical protein
MCPHGIITLRPIYEHDSKAARRNRKKYLFAMGSSPQKIADYA